MATDTLFVVGGCSGSSPACSGARAVLARGTPDKVRREPFSRVEFGGRTTSYLLRHRDVFIVVDQGSGIEPVSELVLDLFDTEPAVARVVHCIQTHYHSDHWCGIQANKLLYRKGIELRFYSPDLRQTGTEVAGAMPGGPTSLVQVLSDMFPESEAYWPVSLSTLDRIGAAREHDSFKPGDSFRLGDVPIHTRPLTHPGGGCGLRFEINGVGPVVVATDYEPSEEPDPGVAEFFDGAKLLLCDMQYRDAEYDGQRPIGRTTVSRRGWGHGTPRLLFPLIRCCRNQPQQVRVVHHDPMRSDDDLREFYEESVNTLGEMYQSASQCDYDFARDGDWFWL